MKQTAVQWIAEQMQHPDIHNPYIEQALQMEREQLRQLYEGVAQNVGTCIKKEELPTFDEYYTQTFKQ